MHKRGICRHAVSVCLSVTFVSCVKTNKDIFEIFSPSGSQAILVFPCQTGRRRRYSDGNPPNGGVECRWGRQKTRFWTNIAAYTVDLYSVVNRTSREVWKNKAATDGVDGRAEHSRRRPPPLFAQDDDGVFVTGSTLYAGRRRRSTPLPGHNPLVITPCSAAVWHRRTEPGGYFCWKPLETIGDSRTEFNRILCTSKSEAAVTSNKKTVL